MSSRGHAILAALLVLIASARIVSIYTTLSHTMDEPEHLGCGMRWISGKYDWDPAHPPMARVMAATAVYLAGEHPRPAPSSHAEGVLMLGRDDHYDRMLAIARFGVLPLFWIASVAVYWWARRVGGPMAAVIAVFLFTTIPPVLAHAGLVTTDMACTAFGAMTFVVSLWWAERPDRLRTVVFGVALGLAAVSKFSLLAFLPAAWVLLLVWYRPKVRVHVRPLIGAAVIGAIVIAAAYRFTMIPDFFAGIQGLIDHNTAGHASYILGERHRIGVWYFFPVVLAVKTPLALLVLFAISLWQARRKRLPVAAPLAFVVGILMVAMMGRINIGVRHVLPIYTAMSVICAVAAADIMRGHLVRTSGMFLLFASQAFSGAVQHPDYIAYTNELAYMHPERVVAESDLDWGQDMKLVADFLRSHGATSVAFTPYSSSYLDTGRAFPRTTPADWYKPSPGWNVVSLSGLKVYRHPGWAERMPPQFRIGRTHWAYYFPP
ncbi:MAG TPA: glycosyltransferase family 39 protein [Candidatus Solibacter sp.]|nr:glycosyltransferase family 39 protein [Candidatus Solibacter sp.]